MVRCLRTLAIGFVLEWQAAGPARLRSTPHALLLTAACTWMLNGIHATPDTGASSRDLMNAILPHIQRAGADEDNLAYGAPISDDDEFLMDTDEPDQDDQDDQPPQRQRRLTAVSLPGFPRGMLFLRSIRFGDDDIVPCFSRSGEAGARLLTPASFLFFFGVTPDDLQYALLRSGLVAPSNPSLIQNKTKCTTPWYNWSQEPAGNAIFSLARRGFSLPSAEHGLGSDSEGDDEFEDVEDIDDKTTNIWRQFLLDVTPRPSNSKLGGTPSHCKLNEEERSMVTEETYKNPWLSAYFHDCQWKLAQGGEWGHIFDNFFPKRGVTKPPTTQNYPTAQYFVRWCQIRNRADDETCEQMRRRLRARFDLLYWMPYAQTECIWHTEFSTRFTKSSGIERSVASPQVLINSKDLPKW